MLLKHRLYGVVRHDYPFPVICVLKRLGVGAMLAEMLVRRPHSQICRCRRKVRFSL